MNALTPRQREITALIAGGHPDKQIAHILGISEGTIDVHKTDIFRRTGSRSRVELTIWWLRKASA